VLLGGVLQQYDTPRALYDRPANLFVATFIGSPSMNLYEAGLSADGPAGKPAVVLGSQRLDLPAQVAARVAAYQGRKIVVGIRPEDLLLPDGEGAAGTGLAGTGLAADVRLVEMLGSEQHVYFSIDATQAGQAAAGAAAGESAEAGILAASAPNGVTRLDPGVGVRAGERVTFAVDPARLYFFDPDTGQAITG
jgi:multiple sugar transport system ATP-binding protein